MEDTKKQNVLDITLFMNIRTDRDYSVLGLYQIYTSTDKGSEHKYPSLYQRLSTINEHSQMKKKILFYTRVSHCIKGRPPPQQDMKNIKQILVNLGAFFFSQNFVWIFLNITNDLLIYYCFQICVHKFAVSVNVLFYMSFLCFSFGSYFCLCYPNLIGWVLFYFNILDVFCFLMKEMKK